MTTAKQQRQDKSTARAYRVSVISTSTSIVAMVISLTSLIWQINQSKSQKHSYEEQLGSIKTSLRLLTASVAPQLQKAIDDSLVSVLSQGARTDVAKALTSIASNTHKLREINARLPKNEIDQTSIALVKASQLYPSYLPAWQAAAEMVSYRSQTRVPLVSQPDCFISQHAGGWTPSHEIVQYHDCTLNLSDLTGYKAIVESLPMPGSIRLPDGASVPGAAFYPVLKVELANGTVRYSGGIMIDIEWLVCRDCSFILDAPATVPPPPGQALSQQLLVANLEDAKLKLRPAQVEGQPH